MRFIPILLLCFSIEAQALTLQEAEKSTIEGSPGLYAYTSSAQSLEFQKSALTAGLFPKLSATYMFGKSTQILRGDSFTNSDVVLRADLSNPWIYGSQKDLLDNQQAGVNLDGTNYRHKLLLQIRSNYFKAKLLEERIKQAKSHIATVDRVVRITEIQFHQGRIQVSDRDRSKLEKLSIMQELDSLNEELRGQKAQLALLANNKEDLSLSTDLPERVDLAGLPTTFQNSYAAKKQELDSQKAAYDLALDRAKIAPDFFVAYEANNLAYERNDRYMVGVEWKLSPVKYYSQKSLEMEKAAAASNLEQSMRNAQFEYAELLTQLKSIASRLISQKEVVDAYTRVTESSLGQYHRGLVTLKAYYDDFEMLIKQEATLLQLRSEAADVASKLSQLLEDEGLFYRTLPGLG